MSTVARGSSCALLGANGPGATALVKILGSLLGPDAGSAHVHGFASRAKAQASGGRPVSPGSSPTPPLRFGLGDAAAGTVSTAMLAYRRRLS